MAASMMEVKEPVKENQEEIASKDIGNINTHPDIKLIRPCISYWKEFTSCCSSSSRIRQIYVNGEMTDCIPLRNISDKCYTMQKGENDAVDAMNELIAYEKQRHAERVKMRTANDIWEYRTSAPENWSKPLPEFMEARKDTHLNKIQNNWEKEELRITVRDFLMRDQTCSIL
ncbi:UPF0545 protein C22orf39 homolog [Saccostrea echinata]|uniref:UPF0545 protein C22orf39 homolog n=1 Tax=Saccostrea echinata TaxID=191078 RepID=UPI002A82D9F6|nr:UPF0545 protein C22orf39 homolog [Saccostrea echinata]